MHRATVSFRVLRAVAVPTVALLAVACQAPLVSLKSDKVVQEPNAAKAEPGTELAKKRHALAQKTREREQLTAEQRIAAMAREATAVANAAALAKARADLEIARGDLEHFTAHEKPRELQKHQLDIDRATYQADHAKDELAELVAMYDADEFAKSTKELVLKRGRRSLEVAERQLELEKQEFAGFREHDLPKRERGLQQKVTDAEVAVQKAEFEAGKAELEAGLAGAKEQGKVADLEFEIGELQRELKDK
ncbi:MAG: hypothetical protein KDE27_28185 [Planctomycetes bacterium]|nr:hypothetical protein [Planctomycetota bacterium]